MPALGPGWSAPSASHGVSSSSRLPWPLSSPRVPGAGESKRCYMSAPQVSIWSWLLYPRGPGEVRGRTLTRGCAQGGADSCTHSATLADWVQSSLLVPHTHSAECVSGTFLQCVHSIYVGINTRENCDPAFALPLVSCVRLDRPLIASGALVQQSFAFKRHSYCTAAIPLALSSWPRNSTPPGLVHGGALSA